MRRCSGLRRRSQGRRRRWRALDLLLETLLLLRQSRLGRGRRGLNAGNLRRTRHLAGYRFGKGDAVAVQSLG